METGSKASTCSTTAAMPCPVVSMLTASSAGRKGATARFASRASRARISPSRPSNVTETPLSFNCLWCLPARSAALAVRAGMDRDKALQALTIANARLLDLQDRIGSLTEGKDADFVVLSGDPLSVRTQVLQTWVEGKKVFDLADPRDRLMAMGGYGASNGQAMSMCCFGKEVQ